MNKEICFIDLVKSITVGGVTIPIEQLKKPKEVPNGNKDMQ